MNSSSLKGRWQTAIAAVATALIFVIPGCGGGSTPEAAVPPIAAGPADMTCADLNGATVDAGSIGLPTRGASVTVTTSVVAGGGTGTGAYGAYCLVTGNIKPIDTSAPNINFQVALPEEWNGKALMYGGSGTDGSIPSLSSPNLLWGMAASPLPLGRGYAVFASDSGHQNQPGVPNGAFASNTEALKNYQGDALKKTRDVAISLITARYAKAPEKSYFWGYSRGGGEAMAVAQRWPADWDGVIAGAPGWNVTGVSLQMLAATQAVAAPGAWLNQPKRQLLFQTVQGVCDGLDGVVDGVINNVRACAVQFNPLTASLAGTPLRCPGGVDTGNTCLSDAQLEALKQINEPKALSYALSSGETSLPGFPVYIADNGGGTGTVGTMATLSSLGVFGSTPPAFPVTGAMASAWSQSDSWVRYSILGDPGFNSLLLDIGTGSGFASRFVAVSALDSNIMDISAFQESGGKLMMWIGTSDMLISPRATEFLYSRMQSAMGPAKVDSFVRFYQIAGAQHGVSSMFQPDFDQLTAIENWAEKGIDPANNMIVTDTLGVPGRTRPVCQYPLWAKYKGSGDVNSAASFTCVSS